MQNVRLSEISRMLGFQQFFVLRHRPENQKYENLHVCSSMPVLYGGSDGTSPHAIFVTVVTSWNIGSNKDKETYGFELDMGPLPQANERT